MKNSKPIADPGKIHPGKVLYRVLTVEYTQLRDNNIAKAAVVSSALRHAEIQTMKVKMSRFNDSETSIVVDGLLVDKDGNPKFDVKEAKKNLIEDLEIPLDQNNVPVQPGVWFDKENEAQILAKDINEKVQIAVTNINKVMEEISDFNAELLEKGCKIG